jgi:5'-nucleotidase
LPATFRFDRHLDALYRFPDVASKVGRPRTTLTQRCGEADALPVASTPDWQAPETRRHNELPPTQGGSPVLRSRRLHRAFAVLTAAALLLTLSVPAALADEPEKVEIQILGLNDFHGMLEAVPATATSGARIGNLIGGACVAPTCVEAGGVEYLARHVRQLRETNPRNTVFVSAGDLIGATPLLSAIFHDEPTIEAFNKMGLDYNGVGNHEFDEGIDELVRMQFGNRSHGSGAHAYVPARPDGCHPEDGCGDGDDFRGARFDFLAANVVYRDDGKTIFPPFKIDRFGGVKVAFVGMTLEGTPLIVSPDGIASVQFLDEAETVNALVRHLKRDRGVEAIVVLLHEGGIVGPEPGGPNTADATLVNTCDNPRGALPPIVEAMHDEIDIVITGHTNWAVNCVIDGKVVTGAASQGRLITDIDAKLNPETADFVKSSIQVNNQIVTRDVRPVANLTELIAEYNVFAGPIAAQVVGSATGPLTRAATVGGGGDSILGRLIADAQLAASDGAVIGFMNPGGIRADINDAATITYGEAFAVQPFSNVVSTADMTGAQIEILLEQQWTVNTGPTAGSARSQAQILQVSEGFTYTWDAAAPVGSRVDSASIELNGVTLDPATSYRVTMNSFLAAGGDDFPIFTQATNLVQGPDDLVALVKYLGAHPNYVPITTSRITRLN